ncbi:MAG: hypothetical protein ACYC9U_03125 [Nitrososphaerales archaeon]
MSEDDYNLFLKLHQHFLVFVASEKKTGISHDIRTRDEFLKLSGEDKMKIRDSLLNDNPVGLIDEFVESNPFNFKGEELEIVSCWKNYVSGTFFLIKHTKRGAIFLEEGKKKKDGDSKNAKAYLVLALGTPFENMIPVPPPAWLHNVVLLPFRGRIVYDGMFKTERILIGHNMARSFRKACDDAILEYGLVESLPFLDDQSRHSDDEEKLVHYMSTRERRDENWQEIETLQGKNDRLFSIYCRELGKANSNHQRQLLKEIGIKKGWFAVCGDVVVASGSTVEKLKEAVSEIMPDDRKDDVYVFQLKQVLDS